MLLDNRSSDKEDEMSNMSPGMLVIKKAWNRCGTGRLVMVV
jgi:hypothetical protein